MSEKETVEIIIDGEKRSAEKGQRISDLLPIHLPCGGKGICGKCKVIARGLLSDLSESEKEHLSEEEISASVRLSCKTLIMGECEISTDLQKSGARQILSTGKQADVSIDPVFDSYGVAVDIGTTTLAASLYDRAGNILASASDLNPQGQFGADVISRIEASMNGLSEPIASAVRKAVDKMIVTLSEKAGISASEIDAVAITGNTAMLYLLTESAPDALSRAPFIADRLFGETVMAEELALSSLLPKTPVYLPPCIAAFVGADTVCAVLTAEMCKAGKKTLLVDIGTNGEMALWDGEAVSVCSTAAGPAFEGVGISYGMRGEEGAIDKVQIVNGDLSFHVIGEKEAVGICGSGLIDIIACLLDLEVLDDSGYLEEDPVALPQGLVLTQKDVRMVQLAKSAISAGISTLLHENSLSFEEIDSVYIAGGFGCYLNMRSAARVGLLPSELIGKIDLIGNAALTGAAMLLLNKDTRARAAEIASLAKTVELSSNPVFADLYMNGMLF